LKIPSSTSDYVFQQAIVVAHRGTTLYFFTQFRAFIECIAVGALLLQSLGWFSNGTFAKDRRHDIFLSTAGSCKVKVWKATKSILTQKQDGKTRQIRGTGKHVAVSKTIVILRDTTLGRLASSFTFIRWSTIQNFLQVADFRETSRVGRFDRAASKVEQTALKMLKTPNRINLKAVVFTCCSAAGCRCALVLAICVPIGCQDGIDTAYLIEIIIRTIDDSVGGRNEESTARRIRHA
jgi:hypothetical protein